MVLDSIGISACVGVLAVTALAVGGVPSAQRHDVAAPAVPALQAAPPQAAPREQGIAAGIRGGAIPVDVVRVIDGDTVEVRAHVWLDQTIITRVRLRGIDAPELQARCAREAERATAARQALAELLAASGVTLTGLGRDKFGGRVVGELVTRNGREAGRALLEAGLARPSAGGRRQGWC